MERTWWSWIWRKEEGGGEEWREIREGREAHCRSYFASAISNMFLWLKCSSWLHNLFQTWDKLVHYLKKQTNCVCLKVIVISYIMHLAGSSCILNIFKYLSKYVSMWATLWSEECYMLYFSFKNLMINVWLSGHAQSRVCSWLMDQYCGTTWQPGPECWRGSLHKPAI